jgi:hypothetical protein
MWASPNLPAEPGRRGSGSGRTTAQFLRQALSLLAAESPGRYAELGRLLEPAPGVYQVDAEKFSVTVIDGRVAVAAGWPAAPARVRVDATAEAALRLVDGTSTLEELLRREEVAIWGDSDAILNLSAAVRTFARAAVDSRSLQRHFERYRSWVLERGAGSRSS